MIESISNQGTTLTPQQLDALTTEDDSGSKAASESHTTQPPPQPPTPLVTPPIVNRDAAALARRASSSDSGGGGMSGWFHHAASTVASTVSSAVTGTVDRVIANQRTQDAGLAKIGSTIDSTVNSAEKSLDGARTWLQNNGGLAGHIASDYIGFNEGSAASLYGAGKGLVQMANGAAQLSNPVEWAANPQANISRLESTVNGVKGIAKIAALTAPTSWITNPQGNTKLASALWNSGAQSFKSDPSKFLGNATTTVATLFIPGGGEAGAAADVAKVSATAADAGKLADTASETATVAKTAEAAHDAAAGPVSFMKNGDQFLKNVSNRANVDPNGLFDVVAHGSPNKVQITSSSGQTFLADHRLAAQLISRSPGYTAGQDIRLLSCSTGATDAGFAQNLANKLGVAVRAPTDLLWAYPNGRMVVAPRAASGGPDLDPGKLGVFRTFTPGKAP